MVNPLVAYLHGPRTEAINREYPRKWFIITIVILLAQTNHL